MFSFGLVAALGSVAFAGPHPRIDWNLADGWKFVRQDEPTASSPAFDDSHWQSIRLPHTWNVQDGTSGGKYYRGPGWYRLHVNDGPEFDGKSLFLRFGAASLVADVYVNGSRAGHHEGGFGAFCFDVTKLMHPGDNLVAVRVDNSLNRNVPPLSGDFTVYGGLYRDVHLLALNPVSISPVDDASPGVYIGSVLSADSADVRFLTKLRNGTDADKRVSVECRIFDARSHPVAALSGDAEVPADGTANSLLKIVVPNPHLWNGVKDPYLYRAEISVRQGGREIDAIRQSFGLRSFRVDAYLGLFLNGQPYDMHGVNLHQGRPSVGWAATRRMQDEDYRMVQELGCTGVRLPHYQHADHEYELCDQMGLVVWAELALVNQVTDSPEFYDNAKQQLRELIKQNYNHPSILFWSLYNEPWVTKKMDLHAWRLVPELVTLAHEIDPGRLTTGAASIGADNPLDWYMDVTAINRYWGWYGGKAGDWPKNLVSLRREASNRTFGISEYGAGASIHQHENDVKQPKADGKWHPEEYQAVAHEQMWNAMKDQRWMWCKQIWVMFDFASASRKEGDEVGINDKGLVTGDRKTRKDAFFFYKANWTDKPFVYITDRRFNPRPVGPSLLKVYSNCPKVELFLNGKSLGVRENAGHVFTWPDISLSGSESVKAVGYAADSQVSDHVTWRTE
jgi:beta-galactosidase